jgi:hypothetical protein
MKMPSQFFKNLFLLVYSLSLLLIARTVFLVSMFLATHRPTFKPMPIQPVTICLRSRPPMTIKPICSYLSDMGLAKLNFNQPNNPLWETEYSNVPFAAKTLFESVTNKRPNARLKPSNEKHPTKNIAVV